ncbi:MAG: polyprenyl synthetase family protein [Elusimicrobiales bacterium]|nr:polyprenyl synthetase family protein [Elusimicrobiales bacterium]
MQTTRHDLEEALRGVNADISASLAGIAPEFFDFNKHPFSFLGKAARARFTLLAAGALGADPGRAGKAAAAAELTHTASLLHDDCLDTARYRRGLPTLYDQLGVNGAILVGDLLIAIAFDKAGAAAPELQGELVRAVRHMTEGALLEENSRGKNMTAAEAERVAALKTGALFRWCGLAACHLAGKPALLETCARLGEGAGAAFQAIDDVLDFEGDAGACGKETLKDIREGKFTLPLILALNDAAAGPRAGKLLAAMQAGAAADLAPAMELAELVRAGGFAAAARKAAAEKINALLPLADRLPVVEGAAALKDFLTAMAHRTA